MPEEQKIGSIAQWGKIGSKGKDTGTSDAQVADLSVPQTTSSLDDQQVSISTAQSLDASDSQAIDTPAHQTTGSSDDQPASSSTTQTPDVQDAQATSTLPIQDASVPVVQTVESEGVQETTLPEAQEPKKQKPKRTPRAPGTKRASMPVVESPTPSAAQTTSTQDDQVIGSPVVQAPDSSVNVATSVVAPQTTETASVQVPDVPAAQTISIPTAHSVEASGTTDTSTSTGQSLSSPDVQNTGVKVVQYTRKQKPERLRQTVYLYPDVLRWVKRRIAETDEEISDVANYAFEFCAWAEQYTSGLLQRFQAERPTRD